MRVVIVLVGLLALGFWVKSRQSHTARPNAASTAAAAAMTANGWTPVPMPAGSNPHRVVVFSALNCPKAAAQRALVIVEDLGARGIPCDHTDRIDFPTATEAEGARLTQVMNSGAPVVFVRGKAKSSPLVDEIVAEYQAGAR